MKTLSKIKGVRIVDNSHPVNPGEYSFIVNETQGVWWPGKSYWMICTPNGLLGNLVNHKCHYEDDGTLSVLPPEPGEGPNSILVTGPGDGKTWHGFIYKGEFREIG